MATSAQTFLPGKVGFKPLNNLQRNIGESLLMVCVPPTGHSVITGGEEHQALNFKVLTLVPGTAGVIKVWDVLSGKLQRNIYVGSVILKMIWMSLSNAQSALAVGLEDGSILLYLYRPPSRLSKWRDFTSRLLPFRFVRFLLCHEHF